MKTIYSDDDMSIMIMLTPTEIKNILRDFANRWRSSTAEPTENNLRELADLYYNISMGVLEKTDPDRFIHKS